MVILLTDTSDPGCEVGAQFSGPTGSGCLRSKTCIQPQQHPRAKIEVEKKKKQLLPSHSFFLQHPPALDIQTSSSPSELHGPCSPLIGQAVSKSEGQGGSVKVLATVHESS